MPAAACFHRLPDIFSLSPPREKAAPARAVADIVPCQNGNK